MLSLRSSPRSRNSVPLQCYLDSVPIPLDAFANDSISKVRKILFKPLKPLFGIILKCHR